MTLAVMTFAALGWVLALPARWPGGSTRIVVLLLALGLAGLRTLARRRLIARAVGPRVALRENRLFLRTDWAVAPLAMIMSAVCGWSALLMRRTTWAGITYEVRGPQNVEIADAAVHALANRKLERGYFENSS